MKSLQSSMFQIRQLDKDEKDYLSWIFLVYLEFEVGARDLIFLNHAVLF